MRGLLVFFFAFGSCGCTTVLGLDPLTFESDAGTGDRSTSASSSGSGGSSGDAGAKSGQILWARAFGEADDDAALAVEIDPSSGAIVVAGCVGTFVDAGATSDAAGCSNPADAAVWTLPKGGGPASAHVVSDAADQFATAASAGPTGSRRIAGSFAGTMFDPDKSIVAPAGRAPFVAQLAASGTTAWALSLVTVGNGEVSAMRTTGSESIVVAGSFSGALAVPGTTPALGTSAAFYGALSADGVATVGGTIDPGLADAAHGVGLALGPSGEIVVGGDFTGSILSPPITATGVDGFVAAYASSGMLAWSAAFGGPGAQYVTGLATDADGNVFVVGTFTGGVTLGSTALVAAGDSDAFVAKLDPFGSPKWIKAIGGGGADDGRAVAVGADGAIYAAGSFSGAVAIDAIHLAAVGGRDGYVIKLGSDGGALWAASLGGSFDDAINAVAVDANALVVAGIFGGDADIGALPLHATGGIDAFAAAFAP